MIELMPLVIVFGLIGGLVYFVWYSETGVRIGLWINGIDGKHADEVVHHWKTGKLPGERS
jgi:hypothetical protein